MIDLNGLKQTNNLISIIVATFMMLAYYWVIIIYFRQTQRQYRMQSEQQLLQMQVNALESHSDAVKNAEEEIANTFIGKVQFDEDGFPLSKEKGHGIGTMSIAAFVKKNHAIIGYKTSGGIFRVRILLD